MFLLQAKFCVALLLLAAALPGSLCVRLERPKFKGISVDWCAAFESDCGQPAADAFCKKIGYAGASSFQGPVRLQKGSTIVVSNSALCDTALHGCDTFASIDCDSGAKTFTTPQFKGLPLDWCLSFEQSCGQAAADYFCSLNGFSKAVSFKGPVRLSSGRTVLPKSGAVCKTDLHVCDTFSSVTCA